MPRARVLLLALLLVAASGAKAGDAAAPGATGPTGSASPDGRDYDMWEGEGKEPQGPEEPAADEIPEGEVTRTLRPKSEVKEEDSFLAPPPEFDAEAVKDPRFADKNTPENWEDLSPEEMKRLRGEGTDPIPPPKPDAPPAPVLDCTKELTLECFVAELNTKITTYDKKKLGRVGCNLVEARILSGGLRPSYRMDYESCTAELIKPFPEPLSDPLRLKQAAQLEQIRTALESFCAIWREMAFEAYIKLPPEGDVRLVETSHDHYRIHWEDVPPNRLGPMPQKYSEFMAWKKAKGEWEKNRPKGKDIFILLKTDRSEISRIERAPASKSDPDPKLRKTEHYRFTLKKGYNLLSWYRYLRPGHRATGHIRYSRSGEYFLPSSVRVDYFPEGQPGYFMEAALKGCGINRPAPPPKAAPATLPAPAPAPAPAGAQTDSLATPPPPG